MIGRMFKEGRSFGQYPLRLVWLPVEEATGDFPVQVVVSVPKKRFKKAVDRNRIRRQVKEAYRLNKDGIYHRISRHTRQYAFMIIYIGQEALPYAVIEQAMRQMARRFLKIAGDTTI